MGCWSHVSPTTCLWSSLFAASLMSLWCDQSSCSVRTLRTLDSTAASSSSSAVVNGILPCELWISLLRSCWRLFDLIKQAPMIESLSWKLTEIAIRFFSVDDWSIPLFNLVCQNTSFYLVYERGMLLTMKNGHWHQSSHSDRPLNTRDSTPAYRFALPGRERDTSMCAMDFQCTKEFLATSGEPLQWGIINSRNTNIKQARHNN